MRTLLFSLLTLLSLHASALPTAESDFWAWLAPQFRLQRIEHPDIDAWEARYRRRHHELEVILQQGAEFLYPLALAVRDREMPLEIALLPVIESHLDPTAESPSGARGLWQMLPSTAEQLGLKQDWWYDESADFNASTKAALDYIDYLHDRFGGWLLGLAAYNAGEGRIQREMRARRSDGRSTDYWHLELSRETKAYVPKLLGLARVLRDPRGIQLPPIKTNRRFVQLDAQGPLDITQVAELSGVNIERIYRLNPQLKRWALPPSGPYRLYLPIESSPQFRQALERLPKEQRRRWARHKIQSGDSLGALAQRYGSDTLLIRKINGLSSDKLTVGQTLIIANHDRDLSRLSLTAAARQGRLTFAERSIPAGMHKVRAGETLWDIAKHYGTTVADIRRRNQLGGRSSLFPGQLLSVGDADKRQRVFYQVQPGDMLSLIAERYQVSVNDIRSWNGIDGSLLRPGQTLELRLPARTG